MTTPDPRTDLAEWPWHRLIEQDQARADEPDDGLIPVTVRLTAEEVRATAAIHPNSFPRLDGHGVSAWKLNAACRAIDLPDPLPPWKSPLDDLPDLTEEQCDYLAKLAAGYSDDDNDSVLVLVGRALIAAGWSPEEEA